MLTLVTGANGHIGNTLVRALLRRGRRVRALVRKSSKLESLEGLDVELAYGDVRDLDSVRAAAKGVQRVFHVAAVFKTRYKDQAEVAEMGAAAVEGTRNAFQAALDGGVERLVYTSSVAAIPVSRDPKGLQDERAWNEDPIDAYVACKTEAEKLAHAQFGSSKLDYVVVNPATVIGPGDYGPQPNNLFILQAMTAAPPVYFANGHSYVDAEDVAEGHLLAEEKGRRGERYILGGENVDIRDLFGRIARLTGGRQPYFKVGHLFVDVVGLAVELKAKLLGGTPLFTRAKAHKLIDYYGYFSSAKAQNELGYRYRPLDEILPRCREWYKARGWLHY